MAKMSAVLATITGTLAGCAALTACCAVGAFAALRLDETGSFITVCAVISAVAAGGCCVLVASHFGGKRYLGAISAAIIVLIMLIIAFSTGNGMEAYITPLGVAGGCCVSLLLPALLPKSRRRKKPRTAVHRRRKAA